MTSSLLHGTLQGDRLHLAAAGAWVSQNAGSLEAQINTAARRHPDVKHVDIDMRAVLGALHDTGFAGPIRSDHGRMIWGESGQPGYGLHDRALGAMYLHGLWEGIAGG